MDMRFTAGAGAGRLDKYISLCCPEISRSHAARLLEQGCVTRNGALARPKDKPAEGDEIRISAPEPQEISAAPEDIPIEIVYEDADIAVVNKPKGMAVHPAPGSPSGTLVNALLFCVRDLSGINGAIRPGIVHRIDKDTTGLLVVAKNDGAHLALQEQIAAKTARRVYFALIYGNIAAESGTVDAPIGRHRTDRKKMAVVPGGRHAVTHYTVLERFGRYTLVQAELETGRTHQIRVHMKHIGHPIVGDAVYCAAKAPFETQGQMLHAGRLTLRHPATEEEMTFTAPLPEYFEDILCALRKKRDIP